MLYSARLYIYIWLFSKLPIKNTVDIFVQYIFVLSNSSNVYIALEKIKANGIQR